MQERPSHSNTPCGLPGYVYMSAHPSTDVIYVESRSRCTCCRRIRPSTHSSAENSKKRDIEWIRRRALSYASFRCILLHRLIRCSIFTVIKSLFTRLISSQLALPRRGRVTRSSFLLYFFSLQVYFSFVCLC